MACAGFSASSATLLSAGHAPDQHRTNRSLVLASLPPCHPCRVCRTPRRRTATPLVSILPPTEGGHFRGHLWGSMLLCGRHFAREARLPYVDTRTSSPTAPEPPHDVVGLCCHRTPGTPKQARHGRNPRTATWSGHQHATSIATPGYRNGFASGIPERPPHPRDRSTTVRTGMDLPSHGVPPFSCAHVKTSESQVNQQHMPRQGMAPQNRNHPDRGPIKGHLHTEWDPPTGGFM